MSSTEAEPMAVTTALDGVNASFHDAYDHAEKSAESRAAVLVVFADRLVVRRGDATREHAITPVAFHALKSAVHAPVATFALLCEARDGDLAAPVVARLQRLRDQCEAALADVSPSAPNANAPAAALLRDTVAFLDHAMASQKVARAELEAFARTSGQQIEALMDRAAELQLSGLHAAVEEALAVIGKQRIDRDLAKAFFGEAKRMQRDLLGDAAARILGASKLDPI